MKSPIEVATAFWREPRGCTCGNVNIGVGMIHADLVNLIAQARAEGAQACVEAAREATRLVAADHGTDSPCGPAVGAARVLDALKAAAREAGAKEPTP